jgi:hypothetical protein
MAVATDDFTTWIEQADIPPSRRTPELASLLGAVYRFRQQGGSDYYSRRLLSHFLLNCDCGLKVAQIARLVGIARPTASKQQNLSSKEAIQQAHHRMDGRPYGKLLPRYAGPIAAFLLSHPAASRAEVLDFIQRTFAVRVSRIALYKYLKKYGLQDVTATVQPPAQPPAQAEAAVDSAAASVPQSPSTTGTVPVVEAPVDTATSSPPPPPAATVVVAAVAAAVVAPAPVIELAGALGSAKPSAPPFSTGGRNTPAPSC